MGGRHRQKKFRQKMTEMNIWLKRIRNLVQLKEWWKVLELKLRVHYRYYESEREHTIVAELLPPCRETRFQMD
ncbi:MAG: hypothetical protein U9Q37_02330 [Euryarchaeota archaeon]|nr:hypothetical protein [Euryarchaeota archaeon]